LGFEEKIHFRCFINLAYKYISKFHQFYFKDVLHYCYSNFYIHCHLNNYQSLLIYLNPNYLFSTLLLIYYSKIAILIHSVLKINLTFLLILLPSQKYSPLLKEYFLLAEGNLILILIMKSICTILLFNQEKILWYVALLLKINHRL
jgi:hypothetical protein